MKNISNNFSAGGADLDLLVITGPTATGKTALGVSAALDFGGEVVSADSMQLYRRMDIGTAKPSTAEMCGIPHHMIDVADPNEPYSVSRYVREASACVDDIISRGKLPIIVGGTGLYIESLVSGRDFADSSGNLSLRETLGDEYDAYGGETMLEKLRSFDPVRAEKLPPGDKRRVIRAIEVYMLTGKTITQHDLETRARPPRYKSAKFALTFMNRDDLYSRIDSRVDSMLKDGLLREVEALLDSGIAADSTAMQAIGYKELVSHLRRGESLEDAVSSIKQESRRYAKRQLTWLRRDEKINWIEWDKSPDIDSARQILTSYLEGLRLE